MVYGVGRTPDVGRVRQDVQQRPKGPSGTAGGVQFRDVLHGAMKTDLKLSAHAKDRLDASKITLGADHMNRLRQAVDRAASKGARESLILMDNIAFVVSVKNRTVITAVSPDRVKDNVFTNIDSAVIT